MIFKIFYTIRMLFRPRCSSCQGKKDVIPILYGRPENKKEDIENVNEKKYIRGGCTIREEKWFCTKCQTKMK